MILLHTAGTVGGATTAAAAFSLGATAHYSSAPEIIVACAGTIGACVAVLSFITGRKNDPKGALLEHENQDTVRFNQVDQRLTEIDAHLDVLVQHFLGDK